MDLNENENRLISENENVLNVNEIVIEEDVKRSKENAIFQT
jgi:hypothetical protein